MYNRILDTDDREKFKEACEEAGVYRRPSYRRVSKMLDIAKERAQIRIYKRVINKPFLSEDPAKHDEFNLFTEYQLKQFEPKGDIRNSNIWRWLTEAIAPTAPKQKWIFSYFAKKLQQEAVTRERFQRLLSPAIAEQVVNGKVEVKKGGEVRETTVLFSDIRGFTAMSETVPAQEVVDMLNDYFELMVEIIFENEGTLDKFVGDEIMALFGAPIAHPDDPLRAVRTAMKMLDVLEKEFNTSRRAAGKPELKIGIGINTGEVVAGYLGSSKALEYTVIGDTVNTGARLCSAAKAGQCLISEWTYERVKDQFEVIELPAAQVKGKAKALKLYNVVGFKGESQVWDDRTRPA